ncbi:TPA_asm: N [Mango betacytorhabdovirus 1]|nr:TPA_asm: N [Mango betacytorhabdovirus 1]
MAEAANNMERIQAALGNEEIANIDLSTVREVPFTDNVVLQANQYAFPNARLTNPNLMVLASIFKNKFIRGAVDANLPKVWLTLAAHISLPDDVDNSFLLIHFEKIRDQMPEHLLALPVEALIPAQAANPDGNVQGNDQNQNQNQPQGQQNPQGQVQPVVAAQHADRLNFLRQRQRALQEPVNDQAPEAEENLPFYTFLAAWCFRLIGKSPQNATNAFQSMLEQFRKFYPGAQVPEIAPDPRTFAEFKSIIDGNVRVKNTWIKATAEFETRNADNHQCSGMVRYLANLPFSFTGMHSYILFIDTLRVIGQTPHWLMIRCAISSTIKPLRAIKRILNDHEKKVVQPNGNPQAYTTYYKYARLMGTQYFPDLQTKNCLSLAYLIACILPNYVNFPEGRSPRNIAVFERIGRPQRRFLEAMAKEIIQEVTTAEGGLASEPARRAMEAVAREDRQNEERVRGNAVRMAELRRAREGAGQGNA